MWQIGSGGTALSPDGKHFAVSDQTGEIVIWDIDSCKIVKVIDVSTDRAFTKVEYSSDGKKLVGYSNYSQTFIEVIDLVEERVVWSKNYAQSIDNLRMAHDGIHFFWIGSSRLMQSSLIDTSTQILFPTLNISSYDCSPTEDVVACHASGLMVKNDTVPRSGLVILNYQNNGRKDIFLDDNITLVSYSIRILKNGNSIVVMGTISDTARGIQQIDIHSGKTQFYIPSPLGRAPDFIISDDGNILSTLGMDIWNLATKQQLNPSQFFQKNPFVIGFSKDSRYIFIYLSMSIKRVRVSTFAIDTSYNTLFSIIPFLRYSIDGKTISILTWDKDYRVYPIVLDSHNGDELFSYHLDYKSPSNIIYSQDSQYLFGISDNKIYKWSLVDGHIVDSITFGPSVLSSISEDTHYGVVQYYKARGYTVELYDLRSSKKISTLTDSQNYSNIAFSKDSKYVICSLNNKLVKLFATETGNFLYSLSIAYALPLQFSPGGTALLTSDKSYSKPILYDGITGISTVDFDPLSSDSIRSLTFSADGKYIASNCTDNVVRVWNTHTGKITAQWDYPRKKANVIFSPDLHYQVVAKNGIIYFQETPFEILAVREDRSSKSTLTIAPNPTSSDITITFAESTNLPITIQIMDILGHIILQKQITSQSPTHKETFSLNNHSGVFYVRVSSGSEVMLEKFVKQ